MRIFKNGINVKWLLLAIGIVAIQGLSYAAVNPIISDTHSYLDVLHVSFLHGDISNATGTFPNASIPATALNKSSTVYQEINGGARFVGENTAAATGHGLELQFVESVSTSYISSYNRTTSTREALSINANPLYIVGLSGTSGTDDITCVDSATNEMTKNTGSATTCAASSEKVKHNIVTKQPVNKDNFDKVRPINFVYNSDKSERVRAGFVAEEFCTLYPEACYTGYSGTGTFVKVVVNASTGKADGFLYSDGTIAPVKGVEPDYFVPTLTQIIQEQQSEIRDKQLQINILEYRLNKICSNQPTLCS